MTSTTTIQTMAPRFDPAALFLLRLQWENLFEELPSGRFRCKGCGEFVRRTFRPRHFDQHVRAVTDSPVAKQKNRLYRDTTVQGSTHTETKETEMAGKTNSSKADTATKTPKVSKTKVAREAAIAVLKKAGAPMPMAEITKLVLKDRKVIDAAVPAGTISAQVNFELAEAEPRIVRVSRGVYAAVGAQIPETETAPASTTKSSGEAKPDPKPTSRSRSRKPKAGQPEATEEEAVTA